MSLWFLFIDGNRGGSAIKLSKERLSYGEPHSRIDVNLQPDNSDSLYQSAQEAASIAYQMLWREGYVRHGVTVRFRLEDTFQGSIHGRASDLLFALATFVSILSKNGYPPLAATGMLDKNGVIGAVTGIVEKIQAGLSVLPENGVIFYPRDNESEIGVDLLRRAHDCSIKLCPVNSLIEAAELLGIQFSNVFLGNPYLGLAVFEYHHRAIFFGRQREIFQLRDRLLDLEQTAYPSLMVMGASGTGKSSLIRAGLIPALENDPSIADRPIIWSTWRPESTRTDDESSLVRSLCAAWRNEPCAKVYLLDLPISETLQDLSEKLIEVLPPNRRFLFLIDQFEEFFVYNFNSSLLEKFSMFIQRLINAGIWVIGTLSSHYFHQLMVSPFLDSFGSSNLFIIPPIDEAIIDQIIKLPAVLADITWEVDCNGISLADRIRQDMGYEKQNILPLLELLLLTLYETRENGRITFASYEKLGGFFGCIQYLAENVFERLKFEAQSELPRFLWHLTSYHPEFGVIDRPVPLSEFASDNYFLHLIDNFTSARLLVLDASPDRGAEIRLAHSVLFRSWPRAKSIIDDFLLDKQLSERLFNQAEFWEQKQRDQNLLISGEYLYEAKNLLEKRLAVLNSNVVSFIKESLDKERQQLTGGNKYILAKQWLERIDRMIQQEKISESIVELKKFDEYFPHYPSI